MPLYQFTDAETGEITRRDLVLGDDVRTLLDAGTYDVSRVEPETLSPSVTITLMATEEPEEPVAVPLAPEILLQGDGTLEVEIQDGTTVLTLSGTDIYDGEYAVASADFAAGPVNLVAPIINGTTEVGETLVATPGLWVHDSAREPFAIAGQWQRNGVDVADGTEMPFDIGTVDQGTDWTFVESATDGGGMRSSASVPVNIAAEPVAGPFTPVDLGTALVGDYRTDDQSTQRQDLEGIIPVTADDQPVRYFQDTSPRRNDLWAAAGNASGNALSSSEFSVWNDAAFIPVTALTGVTNDMEMFVVMDPFGDGQFNLAGKDNDATYGIGFARPNGSGRTIPETAGPGVVATNGVDVDLQTSGAVHNSWTTQSGYFVASAHGFDLATDTDLAEGFLFLAYHTGAYRFSGNVKRIVLTQGLTAEQRAEMFEYLETTYNIGALA